MTPTARTLKYLRANGCEAAVVEKWNHFAKIRQDLFGIIDIVGMARGKPLIGIQATTTGNMNARKKKAFNEPRLKVWLSTGAKFVIAGWSKRGGRGKRKTWQVKIVELALSDSE